MPVISDIVTTTRASTGTYFDANGVMQVAANNVWRMDHDPLTGAPLGALIEESRTNFLLQSENLLDGGWNTVRASVTGAGATRGMLLWRMVPNTDAATSHQLTRNINFSALAADTVYSVQLVAKADGGTTNRIAFRFADTIGFLVYVYVDLLTGQFLSGQGASSITRSVITPLGDGFYRVELSYVVRATSTYATIQVFAASPEAISVTSYDFNGTDGYILSSPQIEQGLFPTSYIPTTTAEATRAADSLRVLPGIWEGVDGAGTIVADAIFDAAGNPASNNSLPHIVMMANGTIPSSEIYRTLRVAQPNALMAQIGNSGSYNSALNLRALSIGERFKIALGGAGSDIAVSVNGQTPVAIPGSNVWSALSTTLFIGSQGGSTRFWNGHIRSITYYPRRLSDAELQAASVLP